MAIPPVGELTKFVLEVYTMHAMASGAIHQARIGYIFAIIWRSIRNHGKGSVKETTTGTDQDCPGIDEGEECDMAELLKGKTKKGKRS